MSSNLTQNQNLNSNPISTAVSKPSSKIGFIPNEKPTVNVHQSINFNWQPQILSNNENLKTDTSDLKQANKISGRAKSNGRSNLFMPSNETLAFYDQARKAHDLKNSSASLKI